MVTRFSRMKAGDHHAPRLRCECLENWNPVNRFLTIYCACKDTMRSSTMDRLTRDEQPRDFRDREVTGERGGGDAQILGDLADADVALVLEVGENLGPGHMCQCRVSSMRSFGISGHSEIRLSGGVCD